MTRAKEIFIEIINSIGVEEYIEACKIVQKEKEDREKNGRVVYVCKETYDSLMKLKK